jgi:hypothetical protein
MCRDAKPEAPRLRIKGEFFPIQKLRPESERPRLVPGGGIQDRFGDSEKECVAGYYSLRTALQLTTASGKEMGQIKRLITGK